MKGAAAIHTMFNLQPGDHLCCIYETEQEHRAVLVPFLRQGLTEGQKVIYIVDEHTAGTILDYLRDDGLAVEPYLSSGQLRLLTQEETYMRAGVFDPAGMIALLHAETETALAEGYPALRITGEMTWVLRGQPGSELLIEYEARLNEFFPGSRCLAICQYNRRRFSPELLLDVLRTHPLAVIGTVVHENVYYVPPAEFLSGNPPAAMLQRWLATLTERRQAEELLRESTEILQERQRQLDALNRLALELAQTLDLPTIYRTAYEHIVQLVDCPAFGISRYDPATRTLRAEYMFSDGEPLDPALFPPLAIPEDAPRRGRAGAIITQQAQIVTDMPTKPSAQVTIVGAPGDDRVVRTALYVPIMARGQVLGLLETQSYRENAYSEADIALLGPVATQIGLAMENARLFADLLAERDSLAQRVRQSTAELRATNQELEAFVYSVSHDLRAPLRALEGFSVALRTRYQDQLDEQGRHYLDRIQAAAQRMGQLIEDLLKLSRVTRASLTYQQVDLSALAREIAAELQALDPQRPVEWVIADGLVARGDAPLLRLALYNLLDNAWKFTGPRPQARIEVGCLPPSARPARESEGGMVYFVRDNGVGFDMAYANKLFAPFQRLHSQYEFPGTGIGLATVQRIITRHGGRVWAEAEVNQGATFYFTLGEV